LTIKFTAHTTVWRYFPNAPVNIQSKSQEWLKSPVSG